MKKFNVKTILSVLGTMLTIVFMGLAIFMISERNIYDNQNANVLGANAGTNVSETTLTSADIISQAAKLLGKGYGSKIGGDGHGHGVADWNVWIKRTSNFKLKKPNEFNYMDCTGMVYYVLTSLGIQTQGFNFENPVPVDPNHWYLNSNGKFITKNSNLTFTYNGTTSQVKVLKADEAVHEIPYYLDADGNELPAGSVIVAYGKKIDPKGTKNIHDHGWIYIGNLGTTDPKEVAKKLVNDYGVDASLLIDGDINGNFTIKQFDTKKQVENNGKITVQNGGKASVITQTDPTSTHWRIECTAGDSTNSAIPYGLYINNGDPRENYTETYQGKFKVIGPIYAFQFANNKIEGSYNLKIEKIKNDGTSLPVGTDNIASLFEAKLNGNTLNGTGITSSKVNYGDIQINSTNYTTADTITIKEVKAPDGYQQYFGTLTLTVQKQKVGDKYTGVISSAKEGNVELTKTEVNGKTTFTGNNVIVEIENGNILVKIKNQTIDLALKKMIQKINGQEVKTTNGFNTERFYTDDNNTVQIAGCQVDSTALQNSTNATYTLNKNPVEVKAGDIVEYEIRIYNEGEVKAYARTIKDYIPAGLTVKNVYYNDNTTDMNNQQNSASWELSNNGNVLTIKVPEGSFIDEFNGTEVKYDYVRVVCEVNDNATGILTNVAEICEYRNSRNSVIEKDIDSTSNNWQAPNDENKDTNTKDSAQWRNYSNIQAALINDWNPIISQRSIDKKGDDDDFDKLKVLSEYSLNIEKINSDGTSNSVIPFTITEKSNGDNINPGGEITIKNNETLENGSFVYDKVVSTTEDVEHVYTITEGTVNGYVQLKNPLTLNVKIKNGELDTYRLNESNKTTNKYVSTRVKDYKFTSYMDGIKLNVNVIFDKTNSVIIVKIENKKDIGNEYSINLRKVSQGTNTPLQGVQFSATETIAKYDGTDKQTPVAISGIAATNAQGITQLVSKEINSGYNPDELDKFVITEIDLGTNTTYTKLTTPIAIYVEKAYDETQEKHIVTDWYVAKASDKFRNTKNRIMSGNGSLVITEGNLTFEVTATKDENNVITLTLENIPDTKIKLELTKVNKEDNTQLLNAQFKINNKKKNTVNGIATVEEGISAATTSYNFKVEEIVAPNGYDNILKDVYIDINATLDATTHKPTSLDTKIKDKTTNTVIPAEDERNDYYSAEIATDGTIKLIVKNKETPRNVDLALKKVITEVDGKQVTANSGFDAKYERISGDEIDTTPLDAGFVKGQKHDAIYKLNKTPVLVQKGSKVKYQLRVYNESNEVATAASEVKDYLPEGLVFKAVYNKDGSALNSADYTYSAIEKTLTIRSMKDVIPAYVLNSGNISYDYVIVECEVEDTAKGILTNVSEISEYKLEDDTVITSDFDSTSDNWNTPEEPRNSDEWINYCGDEDNEITEGTFKQYPGQEDDDDFEKVIVGEVDLVLKKIITIIGDVEESQFDEAYRRFQNGNVVVDTTEMDSKKDVTTSKYFLNKTPIQVRRGDTVTYQIRIYNEGNIKATATEITDYIPKGLTFSKVSYNNQQLSENANGIGYTISNNVLKVRALQNLINEYVPNTNTEPQYDYITVECTVNNNAKGILTNVAEISEYTTFFGVTTFDRDSQTVDEGEWQPDTGADKNTIDGKSGYAWARYYNSLIKNGFNDYPGQQDDDDFEKLMVISRYELSLHKVSASNTERGLEGAKFTINDNEYVTDENGYTEKIEEELQGWATYKITEIETKDGYAKLKYPMTLRVVGENLGNHIGLTCVGYLFGIEDENGETHFNYYGNQGTKQFSTIDENGLIAVISVTWTSENNLSSFVIEVENDIKNFQYDVYLNKVNSKGENIDGVKFETSIYSERYGTTQEVITEGEENYITTINVYKFIANTSHRIVINEIETVDKYIKLDKPLTVEIRNGVSDDGDRYEIKEITMSYDTQYSVEENGKIIIKDIPVGIEDKTIDIIAELKDITLTNGEVRKAIIITIPNEVESIHYSIKIKKVSTKSTDELLNRATFTIKEDIEGAVESEEKQTDNTGTAILLGREDITSNESSKYIVKEITAPDKYHGLAKPIKIKVNKTNDKLGIDVSNVEASIDGIGKVTLEKGETKVIKNVPLKDGTEVEVTISLTEDNSIEITVPNKEKYFDLSLRKFITKINGEETEQSRIPVIDEESIKLLDKTGTALYHHAKNSLVVNVGDEVEYTLRVYNEGEILGYAKEITDYLPEGLSFVKLSDENSAEYTTEAKAGDKKVVIKYSGNKELKSLKDFIGKTINVTNEYYQEVKLICKVEESNRQYITNRAEITNYGYHTDVDLGIGLDTVTIWKEANEEGVDIDSVENTISEQLDLDTWYESAEPFEYIDATGKNVKVEDYFPGVQDDDDFETVEIKEVKKEFDLSLRKFITAVNDKELEGEESREPVVDLSTLIYGKKDRDGEKTATYTHTKEPILVNPTDIVDYTLRIYNEGDISGYASRIIDDVPVGVSMVAPEYDENGKALNLNAEYKWVMYKELTEDDKKAEDFASKSVIGYNDKNYVETENAEEAVIISTDYLSKASGEERMAEGDTENPNLIKAFDGKTLSYKDIKVQFKVKNGNDPKDIITNYAQISDDEDENGEEVTDRDSTTNVWNNGEDDQDIENLKVTWFDLALYKWVSSTIVIEDGKTKEYASGHTQDDKSKVVNVTVAKDKLDKTVVKFKWQIKVENQGIIAGYAKELKDHIPAGLKFVKEDNTDFRWVEQKDGTITTDYLKDTLLQPGETAEVTVVLTWINGENNLGRKVNSAEISEDYNEYNEDDIDSTPNNFKGKPAEDDEDQDEVRLNVRTGNGMIVAYVLIGVITLAVVAGGVVAIKKFVV